MKINFDENCSNSERITKDLVEKVLDFVDNLKTRRKDSVKDALKKYDPALLTMFDKMIDRRAILTHSEKSNGHHRTFVSTANRNLVFYAIKKMIFTVPSEEEMKDAFTETWVNGTAQPPKNCAKFDYLKKDADAFNKFMALPFNDFYILASYCFCEFDRIVQKKASELQKKIDEIKAVPHPKQASKPTNESKKVETKTKPDEKKEVVVDDVTETIINVMSKEKDDAESNKGEPVSMPCGVMETIFDGMSKFEEKESEKEKELREKTEFDKYHSKREEIRSSVSSKLDDIHKLDDVNVYLKRSLVEIKRILDPALFRDNQYSNMKYSNSEVFEYDFDNINVLLTKLTFDIASLERIKSIVDNALGAKDLFEEAKHNFHDSISKEEMELVQSFAK